MIFLFLMTTLICEPDKANKLAITKEIVELEVDFLLGNKTSLGAEMDEEAMQYESEHSDDEGGSLKMTRAFAM